MFGEFKFSFYAEYLVLEDGKQADGLSVKSHNEDLKVHPPDVMRKQMSVPAKLSNGLNSNGEGNNNVLCRMCIYMIPVNRPVTMILGSGVGQLLRRVGGCMG